MVINYAQGNETIWDMDVNSLMNALGGFGIVDGCSISKDTGDWDIDVTSGTVVITGTGNVDVSSGTVTITDSSGLSSGESRITLITADTSGTLASVDGSAATNPDSPDIPSDEVVLGFVVVSDTDSTAADSDIIDIPALSVFGRREPLYGDGSDGAISRSSDANENGVINATTYEITSGTTMTVTSGRLIIAATESITIDGTLDGDTAISGGSAGTSAGADGSAGTEGLRGANGSGGGSGSNGGPGAGGGGDGGASANGSGGDANSELPGSLEDTLQIGFSGTSKRFYIDEIVGASSGGGGGASGDSSGSHSDGGAGGASGATVILIAPTVTINGTVTLDAADGSDGAAGAGGQDVAGGGGGGGSGGDLLIFGRVIDTGTMTFTATAGSGGTGGSAGTADAGDGGDGTAGNKIEVTV